MVCGSALIERPKPRIEADLDKVRWLLDEVVTWDESIAAASARRSIREFYVRQEASLVEALHGGPAPVIDAPVDPVGVPTPVDTPVEVETAVVEVEVALPPLPMEPPPPPAPRPVVKKPAGPSAWQRAWKPFLHESLGWFIGAFLILSGALYLVADAWSDMTSTTRALTVFGFTEAWAVGFAAWSMTLARKDTTRAASRSLLRIAALVAPLSVLTLGSLSSPVTWAALLVGVAVAAFLTWRVADEWREARGELTVSVALTTAVMGVAPVLPPVAGWLALVPAVCAALAFRRQREVKALPLVLTFGAPVLVLVSRLALAWADRSAVLAGACVAAATFGAALPWLRSQRLRGALTIGGMTLVVSSFLVSFAAPKPACVVIALLGAWATLRLFKEVDDAHPRRQWWLAGTYAFAYLAWQRLDQLVPPIVWVWWGALKQSLGYAAAPMPPSYGSVFQALFIAVGALVAGWVLRRDAQHRAAHVWLRSSAVAAIASGALSMVSVASDARPALVALPLLLAPMWLVGLRLARRDALVAGGVLTVLFAYASGVTFDGAWTAGVIAAVLALAAQSYRPSRSNRASRRALAWASAGSAVVALVGGAAHHGDVALLSLVLGSGAALAASRQLPLRLREGGHVTPSKLLMLLASFSLLVPLQRLGSPLVGAAVALAGAALLQRRGAKKWSSVRVALVCVAMSSVIGLFSSHAPIDVRLVAVVLVGGAVLFTRASWPAALAVAAASLLLAPSFTVTAAPGFTWLTVAAALGLLSRRTRFGALLQAPALAALVVAFAPVRLLGGFWAEWPDFASLAVLGAFALASSIHAVARGRQWRSVLVASLAVVAAMSTTFTGQYHLLAAAVVVLLATPALVAWLTVPLATAMVGVFIGGSQPGLVALAGAASVVALFEAWDLTWTRVLNRSRVAWLAVGSAFCVLVAARVAGEAGIALQLAVVVLPVLWARATRVGAVLVAGAALSLFCCPWWVAPLYALVAARAPLLRQVSALLGTSARGAAEALAVQLVVALCAAIAVLRGDAPAPWALALVCVGGPWVPMRVALASLLFAGAQAQWPVVIGALAAIAALVRHAPLELRRLLGSRRLAYVEVTSLLLAMTGAAISWVMPSASASVPLPLVPCAAATAAFVVGARFASVAVRRLLAVGACLSLGLTLAALPHAALLPAVLVVGAVLLGAPYLLTAAVVTPALAWSGLGFSLSNALPVALAAAALAFALRFEVVGRPLSRAWAWLGREPSLPAAPFLHWGATAVTALMVLSGDVNALWLVPLLLLTPDRVESLAALSLACWAVVTLAPSVAAPVSCALSLAVAALGSFTSSPAARVWRHAGWVVALLAVAVAGVDLHSPMVPLAWSTLAAAVWLAVRTDERAHGVAWAMTALTLHVSFGFVGTVLSRGDPQVLIAPWWALCSAALAALRHARGGKTSVYAFGVLAVLEVLVPAFALQTPYVRESIACLVAAGLVVTVAWRRVVTRDEGAAAWLGQGALVAGAFSARVLASGSMPGLTDAWVLLGVALVTSGLAQLLAREGRAASARALRDGALLLPVIGAVFVPWSQWVSSASWLVGLSLLGACAARLGLKRRGALLSAVAFNAAAIVAALGAGFDSMQLLLVPLGATLLVLVHVFSSELSTGAAVKLRAFGMGLLYAAVAWKPLFVTSLPALMLCVLVCLAGVGLGMYWRVRSYVWLGAGALFTTVISTLVRSGLAEPRLGAIFLSALGLIVVVAMVVVSTKREELKARLGALQRTMATWTP